MPMVVSTETGRPVYVPDEDLQALLSDGKVRYAEGAQILQTDDVGTEVVGAPGEYGDSFRYAGEAATRAHDLDVEYGDAPFTAGGLALARGLTIGGSDVIASGLGYGEDVENYAAANRTVSTAAELTGAILPAFIPGGQYTAAGALAKAAAGFARVGAGASRAARVGRAVGAGVAEGFTYGAGISIGEQVRRGQDLSVAAAQVIQDGAMGAAFGGIAGGTLDLAGQAIRRVAEPIARRRAASSIVEEFSVQVDDVRAMMRDQKTAAKQVAKQEEALRLAKEDLAAFKSRGATVDELAKKEVELERIAMNLREARGKASPKAQARLKKDLEKHAQIASEQVASGLIDTVRATRGSADYILGLANKSARKSSPAVAAAYKRVEAALTKFDGAFAKGGKRIRKIKTKTPRKKKIGAPDELFARYGANPVLANQAIREADEAALDLARALQAEDLAPATLQIADDAQGITSALFEDSVDVMELARRGSQLTPDAVAERVAEITSKADEVLDTVAADASRLRSQRQALKRDAGAVDRAADKVEGIRRKLRRSREALEEKQALAANAVEGKKFADELEALAKEAGVPLPDKVELAAIALDLGVVDDPSMEWAIRLTALSRRFGKKGVPGFLGRMADKGLGIAGGLASGVGGKLGGLPGATVVGAAFSGAADAARKALRTAGAGGKKNLYRGQGQALFDARVDTALRRIRRATSGTRKIAVVSPHTTLASASFADIDHAPDSDLSKDRRAYERRAAELDSLARDPGALQSYAAERVERSLEFERGEDRDAVAEQVAVGVSYLHSLLPPRRALGDLTERFNPTNAEIQRLARSVRYVQDPGLVVDDMAAGTVTPEGPQTLKAVYPLLHQRIQRRLLEENLDKPLPRSQRVLYGRMFELPQLDSSLRPAYVMRMAAAAQGAQGAQGAQQQAANSRTLKLSSNAQTATERTLE